ncbi:MAG: DUF2191 domain-containing protein [Vicinamibacteria bacterium]|nr:DUF2191 domain-containing protein [Vicinamibacteria bacterium]
MIEPRVLRELKLRAADEGRTLQDVANELLKRGLHRVDPSPFTLQLEGWSAEVRPGVDLTDRDALFDLMDGR